MGELRWGLFELLALRKGNVEASPFFIHLSLFTKYLSSRKAMHKSTNQFPHQNNGFINHNFYRNLTLRNFIGTRLDSLAWQINKLGEGEAE